VCVCVCVCIWIVVVKKYVCVKEFVSALVLGASIHLATIIFVVIVTIKYYYERCSLSDDRIH